MSRTLTPEQAEAIRLEPKATALLAGAGSGKTTVLVDRYLAALVKGFRPYQLLTVTFTNEAAEQLKNRILKELKARFKPSVDLLNDVETTPYIGTIHSFCYRVLDQYGTQRGLPVIEKIVTGVEWSEAFDETYQAWLKETGADRVRRLLHHFTHQELRFLALELFHQRDFYRPWQQELKEPIWELVNEAYAPFLDKLEAKFLAQGYYAFDDLERYTLLLLRECEEARERFQKQFQYILIDEFQDTSRRQWDVFRELIGDHHEKLFLVGDPKQSIYGFRQAEVRLFLEVSDQLKQQGKCLALTKNFRSAPALLQAINQKSRVVFEGSEIAFEPMQSGRDSAAEKPPFTIARYEKDEEIARTLLAVKDKLAEGITAAEIALLFRVSDRIPLYLEALHDAGIAAECGRNDKLFRCKDILHLVNFLRTLENPADPFPLAGFLRSPYVNLSYSELWAYFEKKEPLPSLAWIEEWKAMGIRTVESALSALFRNSSYWPEKEEAFQSFLAGLEEENLELTEALRRISAWEKADISFLNESPAEKVQGVRLMTVHGAKGLEFPHVFLVDTLRQPPRQAPLLRFAHGLPPGIRYRELGEVIETENYVNLQEENLVREQEEARRILYVALTRAEDSLTLMLPILESKRPKGSWAEMLDPNEA